MSVTLFLGPMFSGKTTALIARYNKDAIAFKHTIDRRDAEDVIVSHNGLTIPARAMHELPESCGGARTVLIDEGQFFNAETITYAVQRYAAEGADVYISALNGTSERTQWETVSELLPLCDDIQFMKAKLCMRCRAAPAPFTALKHLGKKAGKIMVGDSAEYLPVCRACLSP